MSIVLGTNSCPTYIRRLFSIDAPFVGPIYSNGLQDCGPGLPPAGYAFYSIGPEIPPSEFAEIVTTYVH